LPTGDGQKLSLRFQSNGRFFRSLNFSFTEPWLGGKKRNSFSFNVFNTKFTNAYNPYTGLYDRAFADSSFLSTSGVTLALGKQLKWPDDFFSLVTSLSYIQYKAKNYSIFPSFSTGVSNNFNLKLALQRTSIDQPIFPRSGSNFHAQRNLYTTMVLHQWHQQDRCVQVGGIPQMEVQWRMVCAHWQTSR